MDDEAAAALARLREEMIEAANVLLPGLDPKRALSAGVLHGNALKTLGALDKVLNLHAPRTDWVPGSSCFTHRTALHTMRPLPECENCVQDRQREVCPECRDQFGDPVLITDCRVRKAVLAELAKGSGNGG